MTASKMALFPEKALELEHSPQLKMKLLALERDAERASSTFSALATSAESLSVAMATCATRERALSASLDAPVSETSSSANCGDVAEALARERERFAGWIGDAMANERVRKDAEKDLLAIRGARRELDAAKKEYDSARQRQLNTRGDAATARKSDEELDERRQRFESARCDLMMALQRERVGRETRTKKVAIEYYDAALDFFRRGVEILTTMKPRLELLRDECAHLEVENAGVELALTEEMAKLLSRRDDAPKSTMDALTMSSSRSREMTAQMASSSNDDETLMQGYLLKRSSSKLQDWKRRFFVLDARGNLTYVKSQPTKHRRALSGLFGGGRAHATEAEAKETVSLLTATIKPDLGDGSDIRFAFRIVSPEKTYFLRAESAADQTKWIEAITTAIASLLGSVNDKIVAEHEERTKKYGNRHTRTLSSVSSISTHDVPAPMTILPSIPGNGVCADCGTPEPDWASLNLGVMLCIQCSGVHRQLGVQVSKVRSALLDVRAWEPSVFAFFKLWGNDQANARWEHERHLASQKKPDPTASLETRKAYILDKYVARAFCRRGPPTTESELLTAIRRGDFRGVMDVLLGGCQIKDHYAVLAAVCDCGDADIAILEALVHHGVDVNALDLASNSRRTALHLAAVAGRDAFAKTLIRRGADLCARDVHGQTAFDVAVNCRGAIRDEELLIMLSGA